ncbi:MAG: hypothetical protein KGI29_10595, partial [Pseudomonadota bacterium]|nr:hypothetical protein [Pseudomonadota bacterium]
MRRLFFLLALSIIGGLLVWGIRAGQREIKMDAENDQPVNAPLRAKNGIVTLSEKSREAAGIETALPQNGQIPASAVIWWDGKPYVYVEQSPGSYRRT